MENLVLFFVVDLAFVTLKSKQSTFIFVFSVHNVPDGTYTRCEKDRETHKSTNAAYGI